MRYYLDTNILVFLLTRDNDNISHEVNDIIEDCGNILLTSSVCLHELIHLSQIGKVENGRQYKTRPHEIMRMLAEANIDVVYTNAQHFKTYSSLPLREDHRDPYDRLIVAQGITDRIPVISSDRKFALYEKYGLEFVYNKR